MVDIRKRGIRVGQRVAFNRSGQVYPGKVVEIKEEGSPSTWTGTKWTLQIRSDIRVLNEIDGTIAKIIDPLNLLVLQESEK